MAAAGQLNKTVGQELKSKTSGITSMRMAHPHQSVVLVDIPGFNDIHESDTDTLKVIADWLEKT